MIENLSIFKRISFVLALLVGLLGVVVMVGWFINVPVLIQVLPNLVPMQFNTALLISTSAFGLILLAYEHKQIPRYLGLLSALFAAATFAQYVLGINLGIDELFIRAHITVKSSNPGRMAPTTAVSFFFVNLGLFVYTLDSYISRRWVAATFGIFAFCLGFVSLVGYATNIDSAYGWDRLTDMALHTSVGFVCLGSGLFLFTLTLDRQGRLSSWVITPLTVGAFFIAMLLWRAIEVERIMSMSSGYPFRANYTIIFLLVLMVIIVMYLQNVSINITRGFEEAKFSEEVSNKMKTNILRYVSHEIRNPLSAILGFAEPLLTRPEFSGDTKEAIECINSAANHMKSVVDDLLAISQFDSGKIRIDSEQYHVDAWLERLRKTLGMRAQMHTITFNVEKGNNFPEKLKGDSVKLGQIIINLAENAFKYTQQNGTVTLRLSYIDQNDSDPLLEIKVSDNGRGIPQDKQEQMFSPFFQVEGADARLGLGLGLSICKRFVEMMGGTIAFESQEGKGTTFTCNVKAYL